MVMDGFMHLRKAGILKRVVHDDPAAQNGHYLKGAFFLGSKELYAWLRGLDGDDHAGLFMGRVSDVNQLYGGREQLDAAQRKDARFFNICMMATALGAAVSDGLEDGRVVSGVGGQYNFVAMAHAIEGGRSVLLLRSTRTVGDRTDSNVRFAYGHVTIPRHLRDVFVTEYGVADLRGKSDEDCTKAMLAITDARFQDEIVRAAIRGKKLAKGFVVPDAWKQNTPEALEAKMKPLAARGLLSPFPFGSDFTPVEERLLTALKWLQSNVKSEDWGALAGAAIFPRATAESDAAVERLGLMAPKTMKERVLARVVRGALARAASK
jgi:acyl-CoA hydrolase